MKEFSRPQRMGDQLQRELAQLIQHEINDPRLGMVTVSGVELSRDMAHAKVLITVLDDKHDGALSVKVLNKAARFLRRELARRTLMRVIPELRFFYDPTVKHGTELSALIDAAVAADKAHGEINTPPASEAPSPPSRSLPPSRGKGKAVTARKKGDS